MFWFDADKWLSLKMAYIIYFMDPNVSDTVTLVILLGKTTCIRNDGTPSFSVWLNTLSN